MGFGSTRHSRSQSQLGWDPDVIWSGIRPHLGTPDPSAKNDVVACDEVVSDTDQSKVSCHNSHAQCLVCIACIARFLTRFLARSNWMMSLSRDVIRARTGRRGPRGSPVGIRIV